MLDTANVRAFSVPKGSALELYASTLHYAPSSATPGAAFRAAIVLPRGTNTEKPQIEINNREDALLTARNKWLLAHADSPEAKGGAVVGLTGENIKLL
jgi:hypothetical protein